MKNKRNRGLIWSAFLGLALGALTAPAQTNFYWTNTVNGAWDATGNWTNAIPTAGGGTNYVLNFLMPTTTVSTTNTLGVGGTTNGFLLNSLNFSNVALTIYGSNLVFITGGAGGTMLPTFNQNGASSVVFNVGLILSNNTTFGGSGLGTVLINSNVSGAGQFIKSGSNVLTFAGLNTYTNNTVISNGTLIVTNGGAINSPRATLNVIKGTNTLAGGTITVQQLLVTNNTLTATNSIFNFIAGTLTTSNAAAAVAANIQVVSNADFNINGNWTMNGGTNTIASVQTNGTWGAVKIGSAANNVAVLVGTGAVWNLGSSTVSATNMPLYIGVSGGNLGNSLTINGGTVTNMGQIYMRGSGGSLVVTNGGVLGLGVYVNGAAGDMFIGDGGAATNNALIVTGTGTLLAGNGRAIKIGSVSNSMTVANSAVATNLYNLSIGSYAGGYNQLVITNGGQVFGNANTNYIGNVGNSNWAFVSGNNAKWDLGTGALNIGAAATTGNYMQVNAGGIVTNFASLTVGANATSLSNYLQVTGGTLFGGTVVVATNNSFILNNGGVATLTNITLNATSSVFTVDGGTLVARASNNWISGTGSMTLGAGGMTNDTVGFVATNLVNIGGTGNLTKKGSGTLVLLGTNTYSGKTTVSTGTLTFNSITNIGAGASALGAPTTIANGTIDLAGTLTYIGGAATSDRGINLTGSSLLNNSGSGQLTLLGNITGAQTLMFRGSQNFLVGGVVSVSAISRTDGGMVYLTNAANSFGNVTVLDGFIRVSSIANKGVNSALGAGTTITLGQNNGTTGTLQFTNAASSGSSDRDFVIISQTNNANGGVIENTVGGQTVTLSGTVTAGSGAGVGTNLFMTLTGAGNGLFSGNIVGGGAGTNLYITKSGAGTWTLSGSNTYNGGTTVSAGTLQLAGGGTLGAPAGNVLVNGSSALLDLGTLTRTNATITLGNGLITNGTLAATTAFFVTNGTITANLADGSVTPATVTKAGSGIVILSGANTYSGGTLISAGQLQIGASGAYSTVSGNITNNATLAFGRSDVYTNANLILGSGNLVQVGVGTLVLTNGLNNYAGGTIVSNGNLLVTLLNAAGGGNLTVAPNGALVNAGAYTNVNDWLNSGRLVPTSAGALALAANNSENIYMVGAGSAFSNLSLGAAQGANVNFTGVLTPVSSNYYIGGGGGTINFNNNNTFQDGAAVRNLVVGNGGGGTVVLNASNSYSGITTLNGGTLNIFNDAALGVVPTAPATNIIFAGNSTLQAGASLTLAGNRTLLINSGVTATFDTQGYTQTVNGAITGAGSLTKAGTGALVWASNSATLTGGSLTVQKGALILNNAVYTNSANTADYVGYNSGDSGTLAVQGNSSFVRTAVNNANYFLGLGYNAGSTGLLTIADNANVQNDAIYAGFYGVGAVYQTGGTNKLNATANIESLMLGRQSGSYGFYQQNGGLLSTPGQNLSVGYSGIGVFYQSDGIHTGAGFYADRSIGGTGVVYMTGGTFNHTVLNFGYEAGTGRGELTMAGGTGTVGSVTFGNSSATGTGIINLNGGVFQATTISKTQAAAQGYLNFNGGTLQAGGAASTVSGLTAAYIYENGGTLDTLGNTLTIGQSLLAPTGSGVTSVAFSPLGGYLGAPYVQISGGNGTGATAVALFDYTTGNVTGIVVTSHGVGYTTTPAITLIGGGNTNYTVDPGAIALATSTSGALNKIGGGTLTLSGTNTYGGGTIINAGLLQFNSTNAIPTNGFVNITSGGAAAFNYTNLQSTLTLGLITNTSAGTIALLATNTTDAINFNAVNFTNVFLGAAGVVVTNGGLFTPFGTNYNLGGGGGTLVYTNVIGAGSNITIGGGGGLSVVNLTANNLNDQSVTLLGHVLRATDGIGLSINANLNINGGVLESSGTFNRVVGTLSNQVQITSGVGGFSALGAPLTVNLGGLGATQVWGSASFSPTALVLNEITANTNLTFANGLDLNGQNAIINVNATNANTAVTLTGAILDTPNTASFTKAGAGTLILNAAATYGGSTTVSNGTLRLNAGANTLPSSTAVKMGNSYTASLDLNNQNQTVVSLAGGSPIIGNTNLNLGSGTLTINGSASTTFAGTMTGSGGLALSGTGALTLSGNQSYTGSTMVNQSTLVLSNMAALSGSLSLSNGATLVAVGGGNGLMGQFFNLAAVPNFNVFSNLALFNNAHSALTPDWTGASALTSTNFDMGKDTVSPPGAFTNTPYYGTASGAKVNFETRWTGKFIAPTNGTYVFSLNSDDGSTLFIDGAMVAVKPTGGFQAGSDLFGSTNLTAGVHDITIIYGQGSGDFGVYANVALPGGTINRLSNGLLSYGPTIGSLSGDASSVVNLSNGVLTVGQSADLTFAGAIIGGTNSGTLVKAGGATLILTGTNTYGGGTVINNGNLQFASTNAVPANGQITISTAGGLQGAAVFDFGGADFQRMLTNNINKSSGGTVALNAGNINENINFSAGGAALTNAYLGVTANLTYGGTYTPWANTNGNYYRLGGGGGTLTYTNSLVNPYSLSIGGPGTVVFSSGMSNTLAGPLTVNGTFDVFGNNQTAGNLTGFGNIINSTATMATLTAGSDGSSTTFSGVLGGSNALTKVGTGTLTLGGNNTFMGGLTINMGTVIGASGNNLVAGTPFGSGNIVVSNNSVLSATPPAGTATLFVTNTAANAVVGSTFTYGDGANMLTVNKNGWSNLVFTIGNAGAVANSVLVRSGNGVLVINPANGTAAANLGVMEKFVVNGGVATNVNNGMVNAAIIGRGNDANNSLDFLAYTNASQGFVLANYTSTNFASATANSIVVLTANASNSVNQVYALKNNGFTLTLTNTLTLGNGTDPAGLILNGGTVAGPSNLNFGTSEGIIAFNKTASTISAPIAGSSGVTIYGSSTTASQLNLNATNTFTGGLRITGLSRVLANNIYALGNGDVWVFGDYSANGGGQAWLNVAGTFTNNFHISGPGSLVDPTLFGALRINSGVNIAGSVELLGNARFGINAAGTVFTNTGNIFGNYTLELGGNTYAGMQVLLGTNSVAALQINSGNTNQVGNGGTLGWLTAPAITNNGVLLFNHSDSLMVSNFIAGSGALIQSGAGTLILSNANTYTGGTLLNTGMVQLASDYALGSNGLLTAKNGSVLDLNGSSQLVKGIADGVSQGAFNGTALITNSAGTPATLVITDNDQQFAGVIAGNINLTMIGTGKYQIFSGSNTYTGVTTVLNELEMWSPMALGSTNGTVFVGTNGALYIKGIQEGMVFAAGSLTLSNGARFGMNSDSTLRNATYSTPIIVADGATGIFLRAGANAGSLTNSGVISGNGSLSVGSVNYTVIFSASNTYTGGTLLNAGVLGLGLDNALGTGAVTFNGGALSAVGGNRSLTNQLLGLNIATAAGSNLTFTSAIDMGPDGYSRAFTVNGNLTTVSGLLTNSGDLVVSPGSGVLALSATNTYTGNTYINGGILMADFGVGLQTNSGHIFVEGGTLAPLTAPAITSSLGLGVGQMSLPGGLGGFSAYGQDITVALGGVSSPATLVWGADATFAPLALLLNSATADHALNFTNSLDLNSADRLIIVNSTNSGAVATISSVIGNSSGVAGLIKGGPGILALTGNNTYNDTTLVTGGVLRAVFGVGLPASTNLALSGGVWEPGISSLTTALGLGAGQVSLANYAGFSAYGAPLTVNLGGATGLITWGSAAFAPSTLVLNEYSANTNLTFQNNLDLNNASRTIAVNSALGAATITGSITNSSGTGALTKTGAGTLILAGNIYTGAGALYANNGTTIFSNNLVNTTGGLNVRSATVTFSGATYNNTGSVVDYVGNLAGENGRLNIINNAQFVRTQNNLILGNSAGSTGVVFMGSGLLNNAGIFGVGNGGVGAFIQTGGVVSVSGEFDIGYNVAGGYGFYQLTGGSATNNSWMALGRGGIGIVYVNNGGSIVGTSGNSFSIGDGYAGGGTGVFYIANGSIREQVLDMGRNANGLRGELTLDTNSLFTVTTAIGVRFNVTTAGTKLDIINLNGGVLATPTFQKVNAGTAILNFNGGTLQATTAGTLLPTTALDAVYIYGNGANLDSSNVAVTITANLLAPTGNGVTNIPWSGSLSGYVGAPYVAITGGGGTGATAIALYNYSSGSVTGLLVTGAGVGYTNAPTVTLIGGGNTNLFVGLASIGANSSGGLTKLGSGTLNLNGTNSFTGNILVNAGVLQFGSTNALSGSGQNMQVNFGATAAAGYALDTNFLNRITLTSSGTVALAINSANDLNFGALTNVSLGAFSGSWTNSGTITPYNNTTYNLGGGGGTLVITNDLTLGTSLVAFGSGSGGTLILGGSNSFSTITLNNLGVLQITTNLALGGLTGLVVPFGNTLAAGYAMDTAFVNAVSNISGGTLALGANSTNNLDFNTPGLANVSLGAASGSWTNSGTITPYGDTYRLGGSGGTLVITNNAVFTSTAGTNLTTFGSGSSGTLLFPIASNANFAINGNWTMQGGTNRIASVQTNGTWGTAYIGNGVNSAAVNVNSGAVWSLGTNGMTTNFNMALTIGNGAGGSNNMLVINSGFVTNVAKVSVGAAAGANGNQIIITNGGCFYSSSGDTGFNGPNMIGFSAGANSNGVLIAGTNGAGQTSLWDLGGTRLYVGGNNGAVTGNWLRVDSGGVLTNVQLFEFGFGSSIVITNGGRAYVSSAVFGRGGISNSVVVAGADGAGNKATLNSTGGNFIIGGGGSPDAGTGNVVRVDLNGVMIVAGVDIGYTNALGNALIITNGGQFTSSGAANIGAQPNANSNWVYVGVAASGTNAQWNLGNQALTIGTASTTGNYMRVDAGGIVSNFSALTVGTNTAAFSNSLQVTGGALFGGAVVVGSNNSITISGSGSATLSNVTVGGTLRLGVGGTLATTGQINNNNAIYVNTGGTLEVAGGTLSVGGGYNLTPGFGSQNGTLNVTAGTVSVSGDLIVGWNASPTVSISGGSVSAANIRHQDSGAGVLTIGGSGVVTTTNVFHNSNGNSTDGLTVNLNAGGTLLANRLYMNLGTTAQAGGNHSLLVNFDGGTLKANTAGALTNLIDDIVGGGASTRAFDVTVKAGGAIIDTSGRNAGIIRPLLHDSGLGGTPDGGLTKLGAGTLTLFGQSTYTGDTTINAGTLQLGTNSALSSLTTLKADSLGAVLDLNGYAQQVSGLSGSSGFGGTITSSSGSGTLTVNFASGTNNFLGSVSGASTLTLTGGGTLIATATASFDAASQLVVTNGSTLVMNGTHAGIITTYGFSTNGGSGALTTLNVMTNGVYMPGAALGLGTQTVASLTLNPGGLLAVGLSAASNGCALVTSSFSMTNALLRLDLQNYDINTAPGTKFTVLTYGPSSVFSYADTNQCFTLQDWGSVFQPSQLLTNNMTFAVNGGNSQTNFFTINYDALANGAITLTAVPEPGTASLLGLIGVAFLVRRIRRRGKV